MQHILKKQVEDIEHFKLKAIAWLEQFDTFLYLDSHRNFIDDAVITHSNFDFLLAAGANTTILSTNDIGNEKLKGLSASRKWWFGFVSYDLKNTFEDLISNNEDHIGLPDYYFFEPNIKICGKGKVITIETLEKSPINSRQIFNSINKQSIPNDLDQLGFKLKPRLSKNEYVRSVKTLQNHIHRGDIYEVNFCQEFWGHGNYNPYMGYSRLKSISPTPFSGFLKQNDNYLLSASPERYLQKSGNTLISQPIKGTARRDSDKQIDKHIATLLRESSKERSENIMIVDLVRNDLSRIAVPNSVEVEELCKLYSFKQVHQLVSTIKAEVRDKSFYDILKATFPMGSMTGAPKIKAMELAEKYEVSKRGLYSGAIGYITPDFDFDFNVVIRSLQYNAKNNYLSYQVGGAITALSDPEKEYEECLIKASAIEKLLT